MFAFSYQLHLMIRHHSVYLLAGALIVVVVEASGHILLGEHIGQLVVAT